MSYTPTPWPKFTDIFEPATPHPDSEPVARLSWDDYNRARACVNACEGLSIENLEQNNSLKDGLNALNKRIRDAEAQRDRAERALTRAGWTYTEGAEEWKPPLGPSASPLLEKIDQLIAKLEQRDQLLAALEGIKELMGYEWLRPEFEQADAAIKAAKGE